MYKIYIDTTQHRQSTIKLIKDGEELSNKQGDLNITKTICELLKEHNLKPQDIDEYIANPGPGSFTGIKIGLTTVNILNRALGRKKSDELTVPMYGKEPNIG